MPLPQCHRCGAFPRACACQAGQGLAGRWRAAARTWHRDCLYRGQALEPVFHAEETAGITVSAPHRRVPPWCARTEMRRRAPRYAGAAAAYAKGAGGDALRAAACSGDAPRHAPRPGLRQRLPGHPMSNPRATNEPPMSTHEALEALEARIRQHYGDLSAADRKLADVLLARQRSCSATPPPSWPDWQACPRRARRVFSAASATPTSAPSARTCAPGLRRARRCASWSVAGRRPRRAARRRPERAGGARGTRCAAPGGAARAGRRARAGRGARRLGRGAPRLGGGLPQQLPGGDARVRAAVAGAA